MIPPPLSQVDDGGEAAMEVDSNDEDEDGNGAGGDRFRSDGWTDVSAGEGTSGTTLKIKFSIRE